MAFTNEQRMKAAETRRMSAEQKRAEKLMSTGVGPSKIFCDPNAVDPNIQLRDCHIEGKRIGDHYSEEQILALRWEWTDEGFAARNARKEPGRACVTQDPLAKSLEKRRDDVLERGMESWQAENAMQEVLNQHARPGFKNRFVSDMTVKNRGLRGWKPVINEKGDPVKLGTLVLAEMPESNARQRNQHYQDLGAQRLKQVNEKYLESGGKSAVADQ